MHILFISPPHSHTRLWIRSLSIVCQYSFDSVRRSIGYECINGKVEQNVRIPIVAARFSIAVIINSRCNVENAAFSTRLCMEVDSEHSCNLVFCISKIDIRCAGKKTKEDCFSYRLP